MPDPLCGHGLPKVCGIAIDGALGPFSGDLTPLSEGISPKSAEAGAIRPGTHPILPVDAAFAFQPGPVPVMRP